MPNREYTENEIDFLLNNQTLDVALIAKLLNRTERGIKSKCYRLQTESNSTYVFINSVDRSYARNFSPWTPEEIETLKLEIEKNDYNKLSKIMQRTPEALKKKARQIFGTNKLSEIRGEYTAAWLSKIFNVHPTTVYKWIEESGLPNKKVRFYKYKKERFNKYPNAKSSYCHIYTINLNKVFAWLKNQIETNPNFFFDFKKVNKQKYLDEAPAFHNEWFINEINKGTLVSNQKKWTRSEELHLVSLINDNKNIDNICAELDRTKSSVRRKITTLKTRGILTKSPIRTNSKDLIKPN